MCLWRTQKNCEKKTVSRADVSLPCGYEINFDLGLEKIFKIIRSSYPCLAKTPQQVAIQPVA